MFSYRTPPSAPRIPAKEMNRGTMAREQEETADSTAEEGPTRGESSSDALGRFELLGPAGGEATLGGLGGLGIRRGGRPKGLEVGGGKEPEAEKTKERS